MRYLEQVLVLLASLHLVLGILKVRKCCSDNEAIIESTLSCAKIDINVFQDHPRRNDTNWPWWFPSNHTLLSKTSNATVAFPTGEHFQPKIGYWQPCEEEQTLVLPSFSHDLQFYDDGSVLLYSNPVQPYENLYPPNSFCVDRLHAANQTVPEYLLHLCPCNHVVCFLKCCGEDMIFNVEQGRKNLTDENCKLNNYTRGWTPPKSINSVILPGFPTCGPKEAHFIADIGKKSNHKLNEDGTASIGHFTVSSFKFCTEYVLDLKTKETTEHIVRCFARDTKSNPASNRRILYGSLSVVGSVFLALTLVVYTLATQKRTVNDKNLISQTWSLLIAYIGMSISQLASSYLDSRLCVFIGLVVLYSLLAYFFWLNVLCIDLAWAFSELRLIRDMMIWQNRKRFLQYSLYSWISPAIIVLAVIIVDFVPGIPEYILKPEFRTRCWFPDHSPAKLAYFYGPIAVLLAANIVLFIYTAYKIMAAQSSSSLVNSNRKAEKQRFMLYVKLFTLMGLSWLLELVSWAVGGPDYYWYGTDLINLLRAVFIFIMLCCKKQVYQDLKERFKESPKPSGRTTASTSVISLSAQFSDPPKRQTMSSAM